MPGPPAPAAMAGAVDLGALRGPVKKQVEDAGLQILIQNGLVCQCGERIRDEGIMLFLVAKGIVPTPQGPQPGAQLGAPIFHSRDCPGFKAALQGLELSEGMRADAVAIRSLPPTEWLDEGQDD